MPSSLTAPLTPATGRTPGLHRYEILLALIVLVAALAIFNPYFLTSANLANVARQISINGILAMGMTFVIIAGGIDLSVGSALALCGVVSASLITGSSDLSLAAIGAAIGCGVLVGAINGSLVAYAGVPAFVATLGMLSAARGATLIYSDGMPISKLPDGLIFLGNGTLAGIPIPAIIFAIVAACAWLTLTRTVFGRWIYAVGGNAKAAFVSGIPVKRVTAAAFVISGALAGLAALVLTARTTAALPQAGTAYELDAIAAVVIGGTSLRGGVGGVLQTLVGVIIIGLLNNGLDLLGVSSYYQQVFKGIIIVVAVMADRTLRQPAEI